MKIPKFFAILFATPLAVNASPYTYPYSAMTGEQIVSKLLKEPSAEIDHIERDIAHSYVNGVKDATQGARWCFVGAFLPHELNIEIAAAIRAKRKPAELKENAVPLLLAELGKRYPCTAKKGGKQ